MGESLCVERVLLCRLELITKEGVYSLLSIFMLHISNNLLLRVSHTSYVIRCSNFTPKTLIVSYLFLGSEDDIVVPVPTLKNPNLHAEIGVFYFIYRIPLFLNSQLTVVRRRERDRQRQDAGIIITHSTSTVVTVTSSYISHNNNNNIVVVHHFGWWCLQQ